MAPRDETGWISTFLEAQAAELELFDGELIIVKGDVTVVR